MRGSTGSSTRIVLAFTLSAALLVALNLLPGQWGQAYGQTAGPTPTRPAGPTERGPRGTPVPPPPPPTARPTSSPRPDLEQPAQQYAPEKPVPSGQLPDTPPGASPGVSGWGPVPPTSVAPAPVSGGPSGGGLLPVLLGVAGGLVVLVLAALIVLRR